MEKTGTSTWGRAPGPGRGRGRGRGRMEGRVRAWGREAGPEPGWGWGWGRDRDGDRNGDGDRNRDGDGDTETKTAMGMGIGMGRQRQFNLDPEEMGTTELECGTARENGSRTTLDQIKIEPSLDLDLGTRADLVCNLGSDSINLPGRHGINLTRRDRQRRCMRDGMGSEGNGDMIIIRRGGRAEGKITGTGTRMGTGTSTGT
ncbi:hypothetical protein DFH06DRAFT_1135195 [Mycena polygramma]|nr:hypothetical protein DFH06DRAFT_1135195 [Mycena polygramma]